MLRPYFRIFILPTRRAESLPKVNSLTHTRSLTHTHTHTHTHDSAWWIFSVSFAEGVSAIKEKNKET